MEPESKVAPEAISAPIPDKVLQPLRSLVAHFSAALMAKLVAAEVKHGWGNGWMDTEWDNPLTDQLVRHLEKGDPIDVAAYCAFAWYHGWSVTPDAYPLKGPLATAKGEAIEAQAERIVSLTAQLATLEADVALLHRNLGATRETAVEKCHALLRLKNELFSENERLEQQVATLEQRLERIRTPKVYEGTYYANAPIPEYCPECDGRTFISSGPKGMVCYICWLLAANEELESEKAAAREAGFAEAQEAPTKEQQGGVK